MNKAWKVVCCEPTRSVITKAYFSLKDKPITIPNKPFFDSCYQYKKSIDLEGLRDKKIIIYQGIFNYPERKMEELCESLNHLPSEFVLLLIGRSNQYKDMLEKKYKSERVFFVDFIPFPDYLSLTAKSYIGILNYNSIPGNMYQSLNTLYCAPNKIYEYAYYNLPVISNELLALSEVFSKHKFGIALEKFEPLEIASAILYIDQNYDSFSNEAAGFYNNFDLNVEIEKLIQ